MVSIEEVQDRIKELEEFLLTPRHSGRFEHRDEYIEGLLVANYEVLRILTNARH